MEYIVFPSECSQEEIDEFMAHISPVPGPYSRPTVITDVRSEQRRAQTVMIPEDSPAPEAQDSINSVDPDPDHTATSATHTIRIQDARITMSASPSTSSSDPLSFPQSFVYQELTKETEDSSDDDKEYWSPWTILPLDPEDEKRSWDMVTNKCPPAPTENPTMDENPVEPKKWEYKCSVCKHVVIGGQLRMKAHIRNSHNVQCMCGQVFEFRKNLQQHIKFAKETPDRDVKHGYVQRGRIRARLECDFCDQSFEGLHEAQKHREDEHSVPRRKQRASTTVKTEVLDLEYENSVSSPPASTLETEQFVQFDHYESPHPSESHRKKAKLVSPNEYLTELGNATRPVKLVVRNFGCLQCGRAYASKKSVKYHLETAHNITVAIDNYIITPGSNPERVSKDTGLESSASFSIS